MPLLTLERLEELGVSAWFRRLVMQEKARKAEKIEQMKVLIAALDNERKTDA